MLYRVRYKQDGVKVSITITAESKIEAIQWFRSIKPTAHIYNVLKLGPVKNK